MSASIRVAAKQGEGGLTSRLQASTANEETIDVILFGQFTAVLLANATSVDDTGVVSDFGGDGLTEPLANGGVDFLGLSGGGDLASSDGPVGEQLGQVCSRLERVEETYQIGS